MNYKTYLDKFQVAIDRLDREPFEKKNLEIAVGVYLDSVFLKIFKKTWANPTRDPVTSESRIFFSIWINDSAIGEQSLFYNIHALKLRKLKGYRIESRKFADQFREKFKEYTHRWPNVSVTYGPLTLMEGWSKINGEDIQNQILVLADKFLEIEHLIDDTLMRFRK